ncbi:MAG: nucleotide sugar dehydrogenase [Candidatus Omnitrophica bacterium]|nr:nucleotide sugar dehydrogenase [Candidatus Omnitrophota bacterium]
MNMLEKKIKAADARIAVIGLGYVGLPLAVAFGKAGFHVTGIDVSPKKLKEIRSGKTPVIGVTDQELKDLQKKKRLDVMPEYSALKTADVIIICVPTPLSKSLDPDMSFILAAASAIADHLKKGQLIILESTTYPGTTEEVLQPEFEKKGLVAGRDFLLCFSPERIDPGNKRFELKDIPKIVGGVTAESSRLGVLLYQQIISKVMPVSSPRVAEMAKLLENTFRIVNIGLVNELATVAKDLNIDIWEVIDAASTKPFGFMPFYPGPGIGGHCIGVDPIYLSWKAKFHGRELRFIELARQMNSEMPEFVVRRASEILNDLGLAVKGSKILMLGIAYKKDIEDTRESPAFAVLERLAKQGAEIIYHDPYVLNAQWNGTVKSSSKLNAKTLKSADLVLITTDHTNIPYDIVVQHSKVILDTRNVLKKFSGHKNIVRL